MRSNKKLATYERLNAGDLVQFSWDPKEVYVVTTAYRTFIRIRGLYTNQMTCMMPLFSAEGLLIRVSFTPWTWEWFKIILLRIIRWIGNSKKMMGARDFERAQINAIKHRQNQELLQHKYYRRHRKTNQPYPDWLNDSSDHGS
jgi:hypothetical protein